jgi:hypothetical protein
MEDFRFSRASESDSGRLTRRVTCVLSRLPLRQGLSVVRPVYSGISILLVRRRKNTPLSAGRPTFFAFVLTAKPPSCPAGPLPRPKSRDLPDFEAIPQTPLPQLPSVVQIGYAWLPRLSGQQRQSQNPPQHASEQAPVHLFCARLAANVWRGSDYAFGNQPPGIQ